MAKSVLKLEESLAEYVLIRSFCPIYTLVYWLNRSLNYQLTYGQDYELVAGESRSYFPCYEQLPEEDDYETLEITLISNSTEISNTNENFGIFGSFKERVYLFPEQKSADYICVIKEELEKLQIKNLLMEMMSLHVVDYAVHVSYDKLKSKKKFNYLVYVY